MPICIQGIDGFRVFAQAHHRLAGVNPERVVNVGNGVDDAFNPQVAPYEFPHRYLLCVSSRKAHKNESRLLEAFARAQIDQDIHLVLTGNADDQAKRLCERLALTGRTRFLGRVAEAELPVFIAAPSPAVSFLYEGFGLPVIEAMACGTPCSPPTRPLCPRLPAMRHCWSIPFRSRKSRQASSGCVMILNSASSIARKVWCVPDSSVGMSAQQGGGCAERYGNLHARCD